MKITYSSIAALRSSEKYDAYGEDKDIVDVTVFTEDNP